MCGSRTDPGLRHKRVVPLVLALVLASTLLPGRVAAQQSARETAERVLPLDVTVNGTASGIWPILARGGSLFAPAEAFQAWRLQLQEQGTPTIYRGLPYLPLSVVGGLQAKLDETKQELALSVPAAAFAATKLTRELATGPQTTQVVPALFANYDVNFAASSLSRQQALGALGEVGWSSGAGVFSQTFVGQQLGTRLGTLTRLQTSFRRDFAESGYTMVAGDSITRSGLLGRSVYFGGLQFGTNFSLAPNINRQPVPLVAGQTAAPSVVQLYVNDVLRQTSNVPAGPFTLDNLPVLMGNGEVTVRVRDILGRETLITQPFLVTADLLAPGLNDWSAQVGALRKDLGARSNHYGTGFASGLWRQGLTTEVTGEALVEASAKRQAAGAAAVFTFGRNLLLRAGAMAAREQFLGTGARWALGLDRPCYGSSLSFTVEGNTRRFRSLNDEREALPVRLQLAAQASFSTLWGTLGTGLALQRFYDSPSVTTASINYSRTIRSGWMLNTYYTRSLSQRANGYSLGGVLTVPLDRETVSAASVQSTQRGANSYMSVTHNAPLGDPWSWRARLANSFGEGRAEGGVYYAGPAAQLSADVSSTRTENAVRLGATGGLVHVQGRSYFMPRFDNAAALVDASGHAGVGVGLGAAVTTKTDEDGYAFLPRLAPYQANPVRLDPNDLPITAEIDSLEIDAVPPWRSITTVRFPIRGGRAALVRVDFDDGEPAPPGAVVRIVGVGDHDFLVARRGEVYVTGLKDNNMLQLTWKQSRCTLPVQLPQAQEIPRVGPIRCTGVPR